MNVLAADAGLEGNFLSCSLSACLSPCIFVLGALARADAGRGRTFLSPASIAAKSDGAFSLFLTTESLFSLSCRVLKDPCAPDMPAESLQAAQFSRCRVFHKPVILARNISNWTHDAYLWTLESFLSIYGTFGSVSWLS